MALFPNEMLILVILQQIFAKHKITKDHITPKDLYPTPMKLQLLINSRYNQTATPNPFPVMYKKQAQATTKYHMS